MIALDPEFASIGRAAFAEAARLVLSSWSSRGIFPVVGAPNSGMFGPKAWRHHGLGCLQRELTPTLRAHVWAPELVRFVDDPMRPVHDHRFDLASFVAVGGIVDVAYRVEPLPADFDFEGKDRSEYTRAWHVKHAKIQTGVDVDLISPVRVVEAERRAIFAGQVYGISRRSFHQTRIEKPVAVTLVSRSRFGEEPARILGRDIAWGGIVKNKDRDEDLYRDVLRRAALAFREEQKKWFRAEG